ncbi:MAG: hypothetical protein A2040_13355 [Rhodocyclales bacterium GWA2_65_19]|nr:MAG: hypothetical protein A2040_13355 [Rhodocyclales bacterium GWA2_65_19]
MTGANLEPARPIDKRPFFWMLAILGGMAALILAFQFAGNQRLHNTALWQRLRPVILVSPPQVATPVDVHDTRRVAYVVVQTEKGLYFLTGAKHVPPAGSKVVVQANERWDLFLCAEDGSRCMSIHSFCADAVWPRLQRDEQGRVEACFAPRALDTPLPEPSTTQPLAAVPGGVGRSKRLPPAVGLSHPREWAWRMGLPAPSR